MGAEFHKVKIKGVGWAAFHSGGSGDEPTCKFIQVVGRTHFLVVVVTTEVRFPCWLSAGVPSWLLEVTHILPFFLMLSMWPPPLLGVESLSCFESL